MKKLSLLIASIITTVGFAVPGFAQSDYPNKPVKIIVLFPTGGTSDVRVRLPQAGAEVTTSTPQDANQFLISERKRWSGVIERAGENIEGTTP